MILREDGSCGEERGGSDGVSCQGGCRGRGWVLALSHDTGLASVSGWKRRGPLDGVGKLRVLRFFGYFGGWMDWLELGLMIQEF